jgi:NAD(P)-dependent dehydrogenase (short-subunit alcohol dehydrogenase family)
VDLGPRDKVTFAAGSTRGIGFAIARAFAAKGAVAARTRIVSTKFVGSLSKLR